MKHSRLAPSSAFRWTVCSRSISFIEENRHVLGEDQSSVYADEGTRAHTAVTALLRNQPAVFDDGTMKAVCEEFVRYVLSLIEGDQLLVDQKVKLFYLPTEHGTLDVALVGKRRSIFIDLKYGAGVSVYAERNKQLAIYAESFLKTQSYDPAHTVTLVIYQPRDRNDPEVVREWTLTRDELWKFCFTEIQQPAQRVLAGKDLVFAPGEACKFCPATGICKAYAAQGLEPVFDEPVDAVLAPQREGLTSFIPAVLTREQRNKALKWKKEIIQWLEDVENQEVAELLAGANPLDFKLVEGKSNRQWAGENKAAKALLEHLPHDVIYPPIPAEILSPKQAEDALKAAGVKTSLAPYVVKPKGKPTLVPVSDKRPALIANPAEGLSAVYDPRDDV